MALPAIDETNAHLVDGDQVVIRIPGRRQIVFERLAVIRPAGIHQQPTGQRRRPGDRRKTIGVEAVVGERLR